MLLPNNGRIVIVDDKYSEVKPLFNILSKRRIPFNYYSGLKNSELPENGNDNPLSILFLDLNIVEGQHNPKVVISTLHPILRSICPGNNTPYFLIIWSKKISDYASHLVKHFDKDPYLKSRKPVKFINLSKSDYFDYEDGLYTFKDDTFDKLIEKIGLELENLSILKNLVYWENIVHQKTIETINEFSSFYPIDDDWNKNTKAVLFHLAKSIIGNDDIKKKFKIIDSEKEKYNDEQKLAKAFVSINSFLNEKIENEIESLKLGSVTDIVDAKYTKNGDGLSLSVKSKINSKLHLISKTFEHGFFEQGHIYIIKDKNDSISRILSQRYEIATDVIRTSKPKLLKLDLTPVCDYSQNKGYIRTVMGLLVDHSFYSKISAKEHFYYKSPIFEWKGKNYFILIDFRLVFTFTELEIIKLKIKPSFKLRREICTDIQSQLANQINRPGISNL